VPTKCEASLAQPRLPTFPRADRRRVIQQTVLLLLLRQPGELGVQGVIVCQERLLPMQDRRVGAGGIIEAVDLASAERKLHAAEEGRVRVGLEIGINEVRNLARLAVRDHGGGRL
jgi:hypothetical protein